MERYIEINNFPGWVDLVALFVDFKLFTFSRGTLDTNLRFCILLSKFLYLTTFGQSSSGRNFGISPSRKSNHESRERSTVNNFYHRPFLTQVDFSISLFSGTSIYLGLLCEEKVDHLHHNDVLILLLLSDCCN